MSTIDQITSLPLLSDIPETILSSKFSNNQLTVTHYGANEILHIDGDHCTHLELILEGHLVVERIDDNGNLMTIAEFVTGKSVGGNLLFSSNPYYPMTVTAKVPSTILRLSKSTVLELCNSHASFLSTFLNIISDHSLLLGSKIKHYVKRTIRESLMAYFKSEGLKQDSNTITLDCSKKVLADRLGVQRTSLSRALQRMVEEGMIDVNKKVITIYF